MGVCVSVYTSERTGEGGVEAGHRGLRGTGARDRHDPEVQAMPNRSHTIAGGIGSCAVHTRHCAFDSGLRVSMRRLRYRGGTLARVVRSRVVFAVTFGGFLIVRGGRERCVERGRRARRSPSSSAASPGGGQLVHAELLLLLVGQLVHWGTTRGGGRRRGASAAVRPRSMFGRCK